MLVVFGTYHAGNWRKEFFTIDRHVVVGIDKKRRRHVEAGCRHIQPLAATQQGRPLFHAPPDPGQVLVELHLGGHRANIDTLFEGVPYRDRGQLGLQFFDKGVVHAFIHNQARRRSAFLPRAAVCADKCRGHRHIQIGISRHDQCVFGAHLELALHQVRSGRGRDLFTYWQGTGE